MSMSLSKKRKTENVTWLDQLPIEIIFDIFEYLRSNDIIFTFFDFNQRFQDLVTDIPTIQKLEIVENQEIQQVGYISLLCQWKSSTATLSPTK